jgi:hypothetical protein
VQILDPYLVIAAKNACKFAIKRNNSTVEYAVRGGDQITWDDGVTAVTPYYIRISFGPVFPRDVGQVHGRGTSLIGELNRYTLIAKLQEHSQDGYSLFIRLPL